MFTGIVKSVGSVKTLEEDHLLISTDDDNFYNLETGTCLLYTSPSPRDNRTSRMPSSA